MSKALRFFNIKNLVIPNKCITFANENNKRVLTIQIKNYENLQCSNGK